MLFQVIIYNKYEFIAANRLLTDFQGFISRMRKKGIKIINLENYHLDRISAQEFFDGFGILPQQCIVFASRDQTLQFFSSGDAVRIGFVNAHFPMEQLYLADILVEGFEEIDLVFLTQVYQRKHNLPWTIGVTKRCRLREMTLQDLDDLYEIYQDPQIQRYVEALYEERSEEEAYTRSYIENMYRYYGYGMWIIEEIGSGRIIGRAGLELAQDEGETILEMGYLISKEYRNRGYAWEVCCFILSLAAELTGFGEINCFIEKENQSSVCLAKKLGFTLYHERVSQGKLMQRYQKTLHF